MADLHFQIWIPIALSIWTANQMATLQYAELFTLHTVVSDSHPNCGVQELESTSVNVNKPLLPKTTLY